MEHTADPLELGLRKFNAMPPEQATSVLLACCGSTRWAAIIQGRCPYESSARLLEDAEAVWYTLGKDDWLEAFAHHPRIGATTLSGKFASTAEQSRKEQAGMSAATDAQRREFADLNAAYEQRFGHVFLICATGKTPAQMLERLRVRLGHEASEELRNAAREQCMITRLRLERMLSS